MTTLLVASTGGHLKELLYLHERLRGFSRPFRWVTFDTPQSRSSLSATDVDFVPFVGGRDPINVLRNVPIAHRIIRRHRPDAIVSTGSAVALPFFGVARLHRLPSFYIESAARLVGPSLSASLVGRIPGVKLFAQHPGWVDRRWQYVGSVFDSFESGPTEPNHPSHIRKVLVTLGTYRGFSFRRLVVRLLSVLPPDADVVWQTGDTDVRDLGIDGQFTLAETELCAHMREADVVIAHAGVGTALTALELGVCPVLVPRRAQYKEHVDDHQVQVASELAKRGLVVSCDANDLTRDHMRLARGGSVRLRSRVPPLNMLGEV